MNEIGNIQVDHPGFTDAEEMREDHRDNLRRYLDWYGYAGVLEAVSQISRIAIGTRSLTVQEEELISTRCEYCDGVIDNPSEPCPHCKTVEED